MQSKQEFISAYLKWKLQNVNSSYHLGSSAEHYGAQSLLHSEDKSQSQAKFKINLNLTLNLEHVLNLELSTLQSH